MCVYAGSRRPVYQHKSKTNSNDNGLDAPSCVIACNSREHPLIWVFVLGGALKEEDKGAGCMVSKMGVLVAT